MPLEVTVSEVSLKLAADMSGFIIVCVEPDVHHAFGSPCDDIFSSREHEYLLSVLPGSLMLVVCQKQLLDCFK